MTFEEVKEMFKKSIDTTDTMNQAIENLIQSIYLKGYNDALNTVEVEQEPRWIPVSERLPNQDEYIENNGLFNVSDGNRSYSEWFDVYDTQRFGEPTMYGFRIDHAVTAWMPLPKPYKPQESEDA